MARKALLSWSGGKDCAWALQVLRRQPGLEIVGLLTTFNEAFNRVAMHAVRRELIEAQAAAADLPLWPIALPWPCDNAIYETRLRVSCQRAVAAGIEAVAFGDLFLADVRAYRERQMQGSGLEPLFPLWGRPTDTLAREMIAAGLRAHLTCVDPRQLPASLAGCAFDTCLLEALPAGADPCGERGEFHTFVNAGPMLRSAIAIRPGQVVERDGFVFADLLPA